MPHSLSKPGIGLAFAVLIAAIAAAAQDGGETSWNPLSSHGPSARLNPDARAAYQEAIERTAAMAQDQSVRELAREHGLDVLNLTWEDTGRFKNSAVGPNISDMTIQVGYGQQDVTSTGVKCMPVIRYPNYSDKTCDIDPSDFTLLVGNEHGKPLRRISLREFLQSPTEFLSQPESWLGAHRDLLAARDSRVLVSAQACFLPVPKQGKATFNPVLFNYSSVSGDPAVLTVLATREGTSTTVIDNKRDSFAEGSRWGQRLFHNADGERTSLTGERLSDFHPSFGEVSKGPGLSMVLLIQIPLEQRVRAAYSYSALGAGGGGGKASFGLGRRGGSDVESAVIGHGEVEGPFTEVGDLAIHRNADLPVRVTVQFYKATSNGVVSQADMDSIQRELSRVYEHGENVGSLVVDGATGRPTEYVGSKVEPAGWWNDFWERYEQNTGLTRGQAVTYLRRILGRDYQSRPVSALYLRDLLRNRPRG